MSFRAGADVRVLDDWPEARGPCHVRTPHYVRGRLGRVVRPLGEFADPEDLAFNRVPERRALYHVAFPQAALWPDGGADAELLVEIYEHWLEPA
jgi:nitrile hydratase